MELKWAAVLGLSAKRIEGKIDLILRLGEFGEAKELKAKIDTMGKQLTSISRILDAIADGGMPIKDPAEFQRGASHYISAIDRSIQVMIAKLGLQDDLDAQEAETITYNDEVEDTRRYFQRVG